MEIPKVFVSYSHDSDEHKEWVLRLSTKLRQNGVDVVLDRWDLGAGDDMTLFMEKGVRDSTRVLVICTDTYVQKADVGEGGVGYERLIITAQIVQDVGTAKFIPIIRQSSDTKKTPTFLETRIYIDFTDENEFDEKFDGLLREVSNARHPEKPPLGKTLTLTSRIHKRSRAITNYPKFQSKFNLLLRLMNLHSNSPEQMIPSVGDDLLNKYVQIYLVH